ncbi:holo-ACP synthase [Spiroplasma endosymbiont of Amphibalanus improvisus]|uniref:holo-ACP synthase n=1 Tax=Spiroplasma endosymbiont of Amphibalanus improvisus TaxID=3066327 RepID=UPI00313AA692
MVKNIGIDIIENKRIKLKEKFVLRVLSSSEFKLFNDFKTVKRKREFVAGRWACKEAIIKIIDQPIPFNCMDIFYVHHKPTIKISDLDIKISISHERRHSVAVAILQET